MILVIKATGAHELDPVICAVYGPGRIRCSPAPGNELECGAADTDRGLGRTRRAAGPAAHNRASTLLAQIALAGPPRRHGDGR